MKNEKFYQKQKGEILTVVAVTACMALGVLAAVKFNWDLTTKPISTLSGDNQIVLEKEEIRLPKFQSKQEILEKVKQDENQDNYYFGIVNDAVDFVTMESASTTTGAVSKGDATVSMPDSIGEREESTVDKDYSETNTQVQGVDEADIVKTNGDYIYYLSRGNLYIFETKTTKTQLVKTISLENVNRYATQELYIDENYIVVVVEEYIKRGKNEYIEKDTKELNGMMVYDYIYPSYQTTATTIYVYDIQSYELLKTVTTEGSYISSRKIEDNIYVITNKYLYPYSVNEDNILPLYREVCYWTKGETTEEINTSDYVEIPATEIQYFPDMKEKQECSYMIITSLNLNDMESKANIDTYLGAGNEIYCSKDNLYVTKIEYNTKMKTGFRGLTIAIDSVVTEENEETERVLTRIHKFKLLDGAVRYVATGEVAGSLLNQYSMDESNGYFRITTTSNNGNNLFVLNEKLETVGTLKNLAKGEKIYATRFMGDKCYLVTYKTVDPLFVIDLSDPTNPNVLGELKIPGYSTYLHPLGEDYLIGFGEDSVEKSYLNWKGEQQVTAYNVGMKLAIFDVSDLNNPKEIHAVKIGGRGSSSELLYNPKVLYYDEETEIFAFPATLTEETKFYEDGTPMYGEVIFEGALVYDLDIENGIQLRGKIEHKNEIQKYDSNIERIIRIRDNFYTLSPTMLKVTNIETMQEVKEGTCKIRDEEKKDIIEILN